MQRIDPVVIFAYNRTMTKKITKNRIRQALRILLPIALALWIGFIFGNSLQDAETSSKQSSTVVEVVQQVAQTIAPESNIAKAEGEAYARLHHLIRKFAHFSEFAVLGALLCGCYFAYTDQMKKIWIPALGLAVVPALDETLQLFVSGRAGAITDVLIDIGGGAVGFACVWLVVWLVQRAKRKAKSPPKYENNEE